MAVDKQSLYVSLYVAGLWGHTLMWLLVLSFANWDCLGPVAVFTRPTPMTIYWFGGSAWGETLFGGLWWVNLLSNLSMWHCLSDDVASRNPCTEGLQGAYKLLAR